MSTVGRDPILTEPLLHLPAWPIIDESQERLADIECAGIATVFQIQQHANAPSDDLAENFLRSIGIVGLRHRSVPPFSYRARRYRLTTIDRKPIGWVAV